MFIIKKNWLIENIFQLKKNLTWFSEKCLPLIFNRTQFIEVMKKLEISYYLLNITNLVLKLLIDIYLL